MGGRLKTKRFLVFLMLVFVQCQAAAFYNPKIGRWTTRDPIEEEGGKNLYAFCANNPISLYDMLGLAYFAYRPLDHPATMKTGVLFSDLKLAKRMNWVVAHEQLIFEDGGVPVNIGYFKRPVGDNNPSVDSFHFQNQYTPISGHYDDCVMREAVKNVRPGPYKFISRDGRAGGQYNCQDYADDLRAEYYRLLLDLKIRCKCNLK